jgi:hypothetical protein
MSDVGSVAMMKPEIRHPGTAVMLSGLAILNGHSVSAQISQAFDPGMFEVRKLS